MEKRSSGILLPVFSLPSPYGIGCFSKEAYQWVDQLSETGQRFWQILPLGPTGYGDSPYQSFSAFAGNPYFIDLEQLAEEGLLTGEDLEEAKVGHEEGRIRYDYLYETRFQTLKKAFLKQGITEAIQDFVKSQEEWLNDYSLFMALKNERNGLSWTEWEDDLRLRNPIALEEAKVRLKHEIEFWQWIEYHFNKQWSKLKAYANEKNVLIFGDMPIYVSMDSADSWQSPNLFYFDDNLAPIKVAGCPPDGFAPEGQLWGNPLYDWEVHKNEGFAWWIKRIKHSFGLYDYVRIDHFRAFDEYYAIDASETTAINGKWEQGPGIALFDAIKAVFGDVNIIAEDLGLQTPGVAKLLKDSGFPGMKVMIFGFDSDMSNQYLPYYYDANSVAYTGTHDNQTVLSWYQDSPEFVKENVKNFFNIWDREDLVVDYILRATLQSVSDLAVIPLQDYLKLDDHARINFPSTLGDNWQWRFKEGQVGPDVLHYIKYLTGVAGRTFVKEVD